MHQFLYLSASESALTGLADVLPWASRDGQVKARRVYGECCGGRGNEHVNVQAQDLPYAYCARQQARGASSTISTAGGGGIPPSGDLVNQPLRAARDRQWLLPVLQPHARARWVLATALLNTSATFVRLARKAAPSRRQA